MEIQFVSCQCDLVRLFCHIVCGFQFKQSFSFFDAGVGSQ